MRDETTSSAATLEDTPSRSSVARSDYPLGRRLFAAVFSSIRSKIILPYLLLTFLVAMLGTFIVTRLIAGTLEERFANQLLEASRVAGDGVVRREDANLAVLRLMIFTLGVDEAVAEGDTSTLLNILEPLAANAGIDSVLVVDTGGQEILSLQAIRAPQGVLEYEATQGRDLSFWSLVVPVLNGEVDAYGDKYSGLVNSPAGVLMYTSGPVKIDDEVVGAILVGVNLETSVLRQLKSESLADITFYDPQGQPLASTFPDWDLSAQRTSLQISPELYQAALDASEEQTLFGELELYERTFRVGYVPLRIRRDTLGVLGVALPSNFIFQAASSSRTTFILLFSAATTLVVLLGWLVSQRIVRPVTRLLQVSRAITEGDLSQRVGISANDELGILAMSFDSMTDNLQQRTTQLEQEVARVKAILRSIADGVIVRNNEGAIIMMNTAAQVMLARTPNFDHDILNQIGSRPDESDESPSNNSTSPHRMELGDRVVSARMAPVLTEKGDAVGNVLVMRDVTREAAADRLKDDFVNNISHELRTPLTVIKGYSDVLLMAPEKIHPVATSRAMKAIFSNAQSLERMIAKLIDLSEMDAGTLHLNIERINFHAFVKQTLAAWKETLREVGLKARLDAQTQDITINADQHRLRWALDAVLENACQYCPEGGLLTLTLSQMASAAVLQIKDPGVGISGEDLPHVFQRFYRGKPTGPNGVLLDSRGMGQGLYVLKSIVETHGGRVWVESEVGQGSNFSILLPLAGRTD